jgi:mannose-6-phosphate isomerase-like protein (cupin superfamily)
MSAERRFETRRFQLVESTTRNGGARTIFIETMTPGTAVPPHYHERFSETFDLVTGSMKVYSTGSPDLEALEASAQELEVGKEVTVPPRRYHQYRVADEETVLRVTVTPGDADFERLLKIMNGLAADGDLDAVMGESPVFMAVVMGLSDAHLIGPAGDMLAGIRADKKEEIEALRARLLAKYDTDEALEALLVKS